MKKIMYVLMTMLYVATVKSEGCDGCGAGNAEERGAQVGAKIGATAGHGVDKLSYFVDRAKENAKDAVSRLSDSGSTKPSGSGSSTSAFVSTGIVASTGEGDQEGTRINPEVPKGFLPLVIISHEDVPSHDVLRLPETLKGKEGKGYYLVDIQKNLGLWTSVKTNYILLNQDTEMLGDVMTPEQFKDSIKACERVPELEKKECMDEKYTEWERRVKNFNQLDQEHKDFIRAQQGQNVCAISDARNSTHSDDPYETKDLDAKLRNVFGTAYPVTQKNIAMARQAVRNGYTQVYLSRAYIEELQKNKGTDKITSHALVVTDDGICVVGQRADHPKGVGPKR